MTIPLDAIDPEVGYRRWRESFLWHIDQLPVVMETTGYLALPHLRAAKLQEKLSGGGYIDNIPIVDGPGTRDTLALWAALRAYLTTAARHLGVDGVSLPSTLPEDLDSARWWAHESRAWLARVVDDIRAWPDLVELEESMFRLIRRTSGRRPEEAPAEPVELDLCDTCGRQAVLVDWIDGPDGESMLAKACTVCGAKQGTVHVPAEVANLTKPYSGGNMSCICCDNKGALPHLPGLPEAVAPGTVERMCDPCVASAFLGGGPHPHPFEPFATSHADGSAQ